ncbi:Prolipo protein diacylglyceryl transferase-domain-containing protein [Mycena floridula]|nr:Prolipo protein diacylglyceryl transferase-domain-containing protein [Mycena floridula]
MFLSTLFLQTPQLLFIPFASLVTEVTGDFVWILSAHRDLDSRRSERLERVKQAVQNINIWVYSLRIPSIPAIMYSAIVTARLGREERGDLWATVLIAWTIFVLTMYSIWIGLYLFRQVQSSQSHSCHVDVPENEKSRHDDAPQEEEAGVCLENPIHVRFRNGLILTLYGPLMGLGLSMLALVSFLLSPAIESFKPLSLSLLITLALAILFARLLSLIFEDTLSAFFRNPVKVLLRPGFWLQGGLLGAGLGIVLSSMLGLVPDILNFAAGLGIALPLYEFVSRLGCHTYGCCYGKPVSKDSIIPPVVYTSEFAAAVRLNPALRYVPLFPIQLISSVLFFLQFVIIWILAMHCHVVDIIEAAGISFAVHSIIRLWTERFRSDFRGKEVAVSLGKQRMALSVTARIAVLQLIFGVTMAAYRLPYGRTFEPSNVAYDQVQLLEILGDEWVWSCLLLVFFVGTAVYGLHRNRIGRGIVG